MATKPTDDQITEEIRLLTQLKNVVPEKTFFGDDNHKGIDAQIQVLSSSMTTNRIYDLWGQEDDDTFDQHTLDLALDAHQWMEGDSTEVPSAGWDN